MVAGSFEVDQALLAGLTKEDVVLVQAYVSSRPKEDEQDRLVLLDMMRELCKKVDALDGETLGAESAKIDQAILDKKNSRARTLVDSLSPDGARVFLARTDSVAAHVRGSRGDFIGLSQAHPDYHKEQLRQTCQRFGLTIDETAPRLAEE